MNTTIDAATAVLTAVADRFGIRFAEVGTGGGCMALEARLESGHWIVATDEGLCSFRERIRFEADVDGFDPRYGEDRRALGWFIGIYLDVDGSWLGSNDSLIEVCDFDAYAEDLPRLVGEALRALADTA
jgi:hypothetical protein